MRRFEEREYAARIAATRSRMALAGIDVLLVTCPQNMNYLTGYDGWSFYTHQIVALAQDRGPLWIGRAWDIACVRLTTDLPEVDIEGYADDYVQAATKHEFDVIAEVLRRRGWAKARFGVEMDTYYYTARCHERLTANLPDARFADATSLVNWVRIVKSPRELAYMAEAGKIADLSLAAAVAAIAPGVRACDAAAKVVAAQIKGTPAFGGDVPETIMMSSGAGSSAPHLAWTDDPYRAGEVTAMELGGCRHRYCVGLSRSVYLGTPPPKLRDLTALMAEAMDEAMAAVKPGVACEEVHAVWAAVMARGGYTKKARIGYSIGLDYPPDWGEHTASLRPGDRTPLEPGMTFHMVGGMRLDDWGVQLSETFRVTEAGHASFSALPRALYVKDGSGRSEL
ncbi:MAG: M24 family metallopeptidase [Alphaproteobacteria bacterium]|nr:M24 family metallopeptidase [Alphaproteobacteria bacterium]